MGLLTLLFGESNRKRKSQKSLAIVNLNIRIERLEEEILFKNKEIGSLHLQNVTLAEQNKSLTETVKRLSENMLRLQPPSDESYTPKTSSHSKTKTASKAKKTSKKAVNQEKDADHLINEGIQLNLSKKYKEAIKIYKKVLKKDADNPTIWLNMAFSYEGAGEDTNALKCFNKVLELDPKNTSVQFNRDLVMKRLGKK